MGKWFSGIVTTLVVLILTSLAGALLKNPIDNLASSDRLRAEVQLSSWIDKPDRSPKINKQKSVEERIQEARDEALESMATYSGGSFQFARMIITNEGSKKITDISVRMKEPFVASEIVLINEDGKRQFIEKADRVKIADMNPGDKVAIFIWSNYLSSLSAENTFSTYSSAGKFRMGIDWPKSQVVQYDSAVGQFIDEWFYWIFGVSVLLLLVALGVSSSFQDDYLKKLLKNEKLYYIEKERFDVDPNKFIPNFDIKANSKAR